MKLEIDVKILETGKTAKGIVYVMNGEQKYGKPSHDYWTRCVAGYKDFGFNLKYLKDALDYSVKHSGEY